MKVILITGVAGFIGSRLAELILSSPEEVLKNCLIIGLDKLGYSGRLENIQNLRKHHRFCFIQGDITNPELVKTIYKDHNIDTTLNVAAESHVDKSINDPLIFIHSNVLGTATLLEAHIHAGADRFLQVSTDEVYGSIHAGSWDENYNLSPRSPYSASKSSADLLVQAFHFTYGLNSVITRCCNNYGPRQFPEKIIPLFITNLLTNKKIPLYGDGSNRREWIHVDDHCYGIISALLRGVSGRIHHVAGEFELSNRELAELICLLMRKNFLEVVRFVEDRKGHDFRYSLDDKWTQSVLGSRKQINFYDGLRDTIDWYTNNIEWWKPLTRN